MQLFRSRRFRRRSSLAPMASLCGRRARRFLLEQLEPRMMLHGDPVEGPHDHPPEYDLDNFHIHAQLTISIDGEIVDIPANVGIGPSGFLDFAHTHEADNILHFHNVNGQSPDEFMTLGDFFEAWRTKGGLAGNNADAVLSSTQILGNVVDDENTLRMFVNGVESTDFENYQVRPGDNIVLAYGDNPVLTFETNQGPILIELFPDVAPITVENFLNYVNDGDYSNSIFHRLVPGFVLQGGGFTSEAEAFTSSSQFGSVPADPRIQNEFQLSNVRGTIAIAKVGGNPDSATSQWFVNLGDNSANLDNQTGGFTVFGLVLGMSTGQEDVVPSTVDIVAGYSTTDAGGAYTDLPLDPENDVVRVESIGGEGTVRGTVFVDASANQTFDSGESTIESVIVFADANRNGALDTGEVSTATDANGDYVLRLPAGPHVIRQVVEGPYLQTSPADSGSRVVTVSIGSETTAVDFGNSRLGANTDTFEVDEDSEEIELDVLNKGAGSSSGISIFRAGTPDQGGSLRIADGRRSLFYEPAPNFSGTETFTYVRERFGEKVSRRVAVQVRPVNDPPTAVDDEYTVNENRATDLMVLGNDLTDPDPGERIRVIGLLTTPEMGTVTIVDDGQAIRYTPPQGFLGTETFRYNISDRASGGLVDEAVVTVNVVEVSAPPTAHADSFTVAEDSVAVELDVLANDFSELAENGTLTIIGVDTALTSRQGTATISPDGRVLLYTPAPDFFGTQTFTYNIRDSRDSTAQGTVTVTIANINDPPTAVDDAFTFTKDTGPHVLDVLANDSIAPDVGEHLSISASIPGEFGTVRVLPAITFLGPNSGPLRERIEYTPAAGFTGEAVITYTIDDGNGGTDTATATVTIRDFVASRLAGFVYFDRNDNGVFDEGEAPIGGVKVTLEGTDDFGEAINRTAVTRADGSYAFEELAPGSYTIAETQPDQVLDGDDTIGSQGGDVANDLFTITLDEGIDGTGNNFGELGLSAHFVGLRNFFAIRTDALVVSAQSGGEQAWYSAYDDWEAFDRVLVDLGDDITNVAVSVVANGNTQHAVSTPVGGDRAEVIHRSGETALVGIKATSEGFGFTAPAAAAAKDFVLEAIQFPTNQRERKAAPRELEDAGDFYWHQGEKVPLLRVLDEIVVKLSDGHGPEAFDALIASGGPLEGWKHVHSLGVGVGVFRVTDIAEDASQASVDTISRVSDHEAVAWATVAFYGAESRLRLYVTDEIGVALRPGVDPAALFADGFSKYRRLLGTTDQFIATIDSGAGAAALQVANELTESPRVRWATPNGYSEVELL